MTSLEELIEDLRGRPRPILCLDTCDVLDVIRRFVEPGPKEPDAFNAASLREIEPALTATPPTIQLVATSLMLQEWERNFPSERAKVTDHLDKIDGRLIVIREVCDLMGRPKPQLLKDQGSAMLVDALIGLVARVLGGALIVPRSDDCVGRALDRAMEDRRPSKGNKINDSIHWEHYLELARRLKAVAYRHPLVFVSGNKKDFWADNQTPKIHPDLASEADEAGLMFFGRMNDAIRALGY